jgi:hypothetical protein
MKKTVNKDYLLVSSCKRDETTFVFPSNERAQVTLYKEMGGLAKRWGNDNWDDHDVAIKTVSNNYTKVEDVENIFYKQSLWKIKKP